MSTEAGPIRILSVDDHPSGRQVRPWLEDFPSVSVSNGYEPEGR